MIRSGTMRHPATVQQAQRTVSSSGVPTVTYEDSFNIKCSIMSTRGAVAETYRQISPQSTHVIKTRYNSSISPDDRIVVNCVSYDVDHVDNVKQLNRVMEILVHEQDRP
jgi:SPP1 family predicted phage head-tail adaptor